MFAALLLLSDIGITISGVAATKTLILQQLEVLRESTSNILKIVFFLYFVKNNDYRLTINFKQLTVNIKMKNILIMSKV